MPIDIYKEQIVKRTLSSLLEALGRVLIDEKVDFPGQSVVELSNKLAKAVGFEVNPD